MGLVWLFFGSLERGAWEVGCKTRGCSGKEPRGFSLVHRNPRPMTSEVEAPIPQATGPSGTLCSRQIRESGPGNPGEWALGSRHRAGLSTWSPLSARLRGKNCGRKAATKPLAPVTIVSAIDGRPSGACTSCSIDCNPQDSGSQSPKLQWLRRLAHRCCNLVWG